MEYFIFDMETDGLIDTVTKIHCVCATKFINGEIIDTYIFTDTESIKSFFSVEKTIVGHNIRRFDIPVLEKILNIKINLKFIDTLALSWYLYLNRNEHGLESWGVDFGIQKPPITDWSNLTVEEYIYRCSEDVKINTALFDIEMSYLMELYEHNLTGVMRLINYLMFKMDCAAEQEEIKWKLDIQKTEEGLAFLLDEQKEKFKVLQIIMPKVVKYKDAPRPKNIFKKDGELSEAGIRWMGYLKLFGYPDYHVGTLRVPTGEEELGNPGSHHQLKTWLFGLGWEPEVFKYSKNKKGEVSKIPQINTSEGICDSVKRLYDDNPDLHHLEGYFVIRHRIGILEGFLENKDKNGRVIAAVQGFTNTLRFKHTIVVNLPVLFRAYGDRIRSCLVADEGYKLCGADISGVEEGTKHHYMMYYDPLYVKEQRQYGFDPHLDIAVQAKLISIDEMNWYKWQKKDEVEEGMNKKVFGPLVPDHLKNMTIDESKVLKTKIAEIRDRSKKSNFAAVYGAGIPKIALTARIPISLSRIFYKAYWRRNHSVKKIANSCKIRTVGSQMWLHNPVSQFWYPLKLEKDKFSTLNQSTAVYVFDTWVRKVRSKGIKLCGQYHDELIAPVTIGNESRMQQTIKDSMDEANKELQMKIEFGISVQFGDRYSDIH